MPDAEPLMATGNAPAPLLPGTRIDAGTVAFDVSLLARVTSAPPAGVGPEKKIVAEVDVVPVCTIAGSRNTESNVGAGTTGGGVTVSCAVRVSPLYVAEMTAVCVVVTANVVTNVTLLLTPAGTVSVAGTVTAAVLLLDNDTTAPPGGATAVSVTVPATVVPPCTLVEPRLIDASDAVAGGTVVVDVVLGVVVEVVGDGTVVGVTAVHPESRALVGAPVPSPTSTVQSDGGVKPSRSILKLPEVLLVAIATPSTVIERCGAA